MTEKAQQGAPKRHLRRWIGRLAALVLSAAALNATAQPASPGPTTPLVIETRTGEAAFEVEVARTPQERARGLMYRTELAPDRGMLFDFGQSQPVSMWMRNTLIPLDMLFIDGGGRIRRIAAKTEPLSDAVVRSGSPVRAVLEIAGGRSQELGIEPGDRVVHPLFRVE